MYSPHSFLPLLQFPRMRRRTGAGTQSTAGLITSSAGRLVAPDPQAVGQPEHHAYLEEPLVSQ